MLSLVNRATPRGRRLRGRGRHRMELVDVTKCNTLALPHLKTCTKCLRTLAIDAFSVGQNTRFGRHSICKDCCSQYNRRRYIRRRDHIKGMVSARRLADPHAILRTRLSTHAKNPTKANARRCVEAAVLASVIVKPDCCESCGTSNQSHGRWKVHAHHEDYTNPLAVVYLCPKCHAAAHPEKWAKTPCVVCGRMISVSSMTNHMTFSHSSHQGTRN